MNDELVELVWRRAGDACEYCRLPQTFSKLTFEIDHVIAKKHGGKTVSSNLALACFFCNNYKGPNVAGVDPQTGKIVRLFHPRRHKWSHHFLWKGATLVGRTAMGRVTVAVLEINEPEAVALRETLIQAGHFPPMS